MDEEIDDERKRTSFDSHSSAFVRSQRSTCSLDLPKRVKHEIPSHYSPREEAQLILQEQSKGGRPPFIREKPPNTVISEGQPLTLSCVVIGDPEPVVQWFRNDVILGDTGRVVMTSRGGKSQLCFSECRNFDMGLYKVVARNSLGQAVHKFRLVKADIPGLTDPPEAISVSVTEALLKWKPPRDDGGSPVTCYHLQIKPQGESEWLRISDCIEHEDHLVQELKPNSLYMFRVASKNQTGWSEFSVASIPIRTTAKAESCLQMPIEQQLQQKSERLYVLQLPGARGEIRDMLDYGREKQHVPLKEGDTALLQIRKYKMISELHRGRFSCVLRCLRHDDRRTFACKALLRQGRERAVKHEFDAMKSLRHERLVTLYEAYHLNNLTAFIMEFLGGPDVLEFLTNSYEYSEQHVCVVVNQVLDALSYLHWRGFCHLDIQPDNVIVASTRRLDVKLGDFGSVQSVPRGGSQVPLNGLLDYVAPEILSDQRAVPSSDVWSVGVLTYVLLTGQSPFLGPDDQETQTNIQFVRLRFECLGNVVSQEATRFMMLVFKRDPCKRPTIEDCRDHKWLAENEFMVKKRERVVFQPTRLQEYSKWYHSVRSKQATTDPALAAFLQEQC